MAGSKLRTCKRYLAALASRPQMRNLLTGGVVEKTFRTSENLGTPDIQKREAQFTYAEGDEYVFMDNESYVSGAAARAGRRAAMQGWDEHRP